MPRRFTDERPLAAALRACPAARHPALLAGAIASPRDPAARLALAEALDAEGDPWGELIRLQLAWDPLDPVDRDGARASLVRQAQILRAHPRLHAAVAGTVGSRGSLTMSGGLVDGAEVSAQAILDAAPEIFALAPVLRLDPLPMSPRQLTALAHVPELARVTSMRLTCPDAGDADLRPLIEALPRLESLDLHDVRAGDETLVLLDSRFASSALRRLTLTSGRYGRAALAALCAGRTMRGLRRVTFAGRWIDEAFLAALTRHVDSLEALSITGGRAPTLAPLTRARFLPALEALELGPPSDGPSASAVLTRTARLRSLYFSGGAGRDVVGAVATMPALRTLGLVGGGLDPGACATLARGAPSLGWLDLSANPIGDEGARALAGAGFAAALTRLALHGCDVGLRGLDALTAAMPSLIALDLGGNRLGDEGAELLARSSALGSLELLRLSGCGIGERGARALLDSAHLSPRTRVALDVGAGREARRVLRERHAALEPLLMI